MVECAVVFSVGSFLIVLIYTFGRAILFLFQMVVEGELNRVCYIYLCYIAAIAI